MRGSRINGRIAGVTAVLAVFSALGVGTALAEGDGAKADRYNQLRMAAYTYNAETQEYDVSTCSSIQWKAVKADSPIDTNHRALVVNICEGDFAEAYTRASLNIDTPVGDIQNLSYDFRTDLVGGGAPRISVIFKNGDVAYLTASTCSSPLAASGGSWSRADFTGDVTDCSFSVSGETAGTYSANGTMSAWDVYAATHPNQEVSYAFLVFDEAGKYRLDRIALGTDYLYNYSADMAYSCNGRESRC